MTGRQAPAVRPFSERYGPWAVVTGAARAEGIGFGFARHLAGRHVNVVLVDVLGDELELRAQELRDRYHVKVESVPLDLGAVDFIDELHVATAGLDVGLVVCNHALIPMEAPTILDTPLETHHQMIDVNARAYTTLVHHFGRRFVTAGRGGILLVSSQGGLRGTAFEGGYSANKAFQMMLGESLWYELRGTGVDVLVLAPGLTRTQGDGMDGYPQVMVMPVDPVVAEALDGLGQRHLVIPGRLNKVFHVMTSRFMSRRRAVTTNGSFMARGLGRDPSRPFVGPGAPVRPGDTAWTHPDP
ncbi:MAG: SDR family NAD(P)-dependent oxidoreductase [Actinomycetota bacterium]|nr:SDR family NAD(P)-dependent oxidoreductase [Actinomycetota bacterium]